MNQISFSDHIFNTYYSLVILSSSSLGENTDTFFCFFNPLSPENMGQLYVIASAR